MRIVAGSLRGCALAAPPGAETRPTGDRARAALFNILDHGALAAAGSVYRGCTVLDAFAGTGALGLEAVSRGAAQAIFMELAPAALRALDGNIAALGLGAVATVLRADATRPPTAIAAASLALLDPPYGKGLGPVALAALDTAGWLAPGAVAVVEVAKREPFEPPPGFERVDERVYGAARLVFLKRQR